MTIINKPPLLLPVHCIINKKQIHAAKEHTKLYGLIFLTCWLFTWLGTIDRENFYIENILVVVSLAALAITYRYFAFSTTSYTFILLFLLLHIYGAQYAYTANPAGEWLQQRFSLTRNPYDRIVHFSFGLLLAYPAMDMIRNKWKISGRLSWYLPVELIFALAAAFELVEWAVADFIFPAQGASYVATQGDMWDAQKDIFVAVAGAVLILFVVWLVKKQSAHKKAMYETLLMNIE